MCAEEARSSVLAFFDAPPEEYTVVFTPNATGALRLVGEAFPFVQDSTFILGADSHNSINGIRQFALTKGARLAYIASTSIGGMNESDAKVPLLSLFRQGRRILTTFVEHLDGSWPPITARWSARFVRIDGVIERDK